MPETRLSAVVPAAGRSARFGGQKLLADVGGRPLIVRTLETLAAGGVSDVIVVVGPASPVELIDLLGEQPVTVVVNPEPERGMFSSIHTGLGRTDGSPVLVLPADMPFVASATVRAISEACQATGLVVVPAIGTKRGHPVAIPGSICEAIVANDDPRGTLKDALAAAGGTPTELQVDDPGILVDIDVPADLGGQSP